MILNKTTLLSLFLFLIVFSAQSQTADSLQKRNFIKKTILPATLISVGALFTNSTFEKEFQTKIREKVGRDFQFKLDNYIQYAPIATMYLANLAGIKGKNHWFDQSKNLLLANIISAGITHGLKNVITKTRPNGLDHSFPSGHTTLAFTNAAVLFHEYRNNSSLIAYSGYAFAVTTGSLRILNNRHWFSDVIVGAGIGILAAEIVYYFEPLRNFNPFKKSEKFTLIPSYSESNYGFYFSYTF